MQWNQRRVARLAFLCGSGASIDTIMRDELIAARSAQAVRVVASRLKVPIRAGDGPLVLPLSDDDRRELIAAARRRGITTNDLAGLLVHFAVRDRLIAAIIDDGR